MIKTKLLTTNTKLEKAKKLGYIFRRPVAVVFSTKKGKPLPRKFKGYKVVDGDEHDLTFLHPNGVVIGLRAKGKAIGDQSGFAVQV